MVEIGRLIISIKEDKIMAREVITIDGARDAYSIGQILDDKWKKTLTVGELMEILEMFDEDTPIVIKNDNGYTYGFITEQTINEDYDGEDEEEE